MHPLFKLWLLIAGSVVLLSGVFYLAENHAQFFGNFYVLMGIWIAGYWVFALARRIIRLSRKRGSALPPTT